MDIKQLRHAIAFAEEASLSAGAAPTCIAQCSLSQHVKDPADYPEVGSGLIV